MKKFLLNCGIYLGVAISAVSCSKDDDQPQALSTESEFTVSEARTFFERNADVMRPLDLSRRHRPGSGADLSQSDMVPLWSKAQAYEKAGSRIVEVPLQVYGAYRAYAHYADKNKAGYMADGEVIVHLLIEKQAGAAAPSCFITSFIPDKEFLCGGRDKADALRLFLEAETGYTGLVIRSEMDGKPRGGLMYEGGKITGRLRSGESVPKDKEPGRMLLGMVNVATKGGDGGGGSGFHGDEYEGMYWCTKCLMYHATPQCIWIDDAPVIEKVCRECGKLIENCVCCMKCHKYPCVCGETDKDLPDPWEDPEGGKGAGSGSGSGSDITEPPANEKPQVATEVECSGQAAANSNGALNRLSQFMNVGLQDQFIERYKDAGEEHGATLNYNSQTGTFVMDNTFASNGNKREVVMTYKVGEDEKSVASVHNHISGAGPSPTDVITTAQVNEHTGGEYTTSFVIAGDGTIYALQVEDAAKAKIFYEIYKDENKKQALKNEYVSLATAIQEDCPSIDFKDIFIYTIAYQLNVHDTGIKLLVKDPDSGAFKQKDAYGDFIHTTRITCK